MELLINNGLLIQWGKITVSTSTNYRIFIMPISYTKFVVYMVTPTTSLNAFSSHDNAQTWYAAKSQIANTQYNLSQFICNGNNILFWLTIGF